VKTYSVPVSCDPADLDDHHGTETLRARFERLDGVELRGVDFVSGGARLLVEAASPDQAKERAVEAAERCISEAADWEAGEPVEVLD
jgi:hypothetical protein